MNDGEELVKEMKSDLFSKTLSVKLNAIKKLTVKHEMSNKAKDHELISINNNNNKLSNLEKRKSVLDHYSNLNKPHRLINNKSNEANNNNNNEKKKKKEEKKETLSKAQQLLLETHMKSKVLMK